MNDFVHDFMRGVHHDIEEVGLNESLQGRYHCLIPDVAVDYLHHLFLDPFFPKVLPPLLMLRFGCLFFRGGNDRHCPTKLAAGY
jgi:hypothetical protein